MRLEESHLSDQELLLAADGELSGARAAKVKAHLAGCRECQARQQEIRETLSDFVRSHQQALDPTAAVPSGSRALLKARLRELAVTQQPRGWLRAGSWRSSWALAASMCGLAVLGGLLVRWIGVERPAAPAVAVSVPNTALTPGATVRVSSTQLCAASSGKNRTVPAALRRRVFQEYGIAGAEPRAYEVDYLITPALGGADDIRNLWPQSYSSTVWNARVKDDLEDRLHELVCQGQLDLATAQRDLADDWITAYKKYFHTDQPLSATRDY